jgi:hypothetical protein
MSDRRRPLALALALVLLASRAAAKEPPGRPWKQEPTTYRGVAFGVGQEDALEGDVCWPGDRMCAGPREMIADVEVTEAWFFLNDKFSAVAQSFDSGGYETVREVFIRKYGPPHETRRGLFETRGGARSQNERLTWRGRKIVIELIRYSENINDASAVIATKEYLRAEEIRLEAEKKKAADVF